MPEPCLIFETLKICFFHHQESKKKELIKNLDALYGQLQREHQISPGDFPDIKKMQEVLQHQDFAKFKALDKRLLDRVWKSISFEICQSIEGE